MKNLLAVLFLSALLLIGSSPCFSENPGGMTGKQAPDFRAESLSGEKMRLYDLLDGNNLVILSFFDTKCEPCKKELPLLEKVKRDYKGNLKLFLIGLDDKKTEIISWQQKQKTALDILHDPMGYRAGETYGVTKLGRSEIPQTFVIGKDGKIGGHFKGLHPDIDKKILALLPALAEKAAAPTPSQRQAQNTLTIIYTNSANGYLESCDCPENPFGGLVRRVTAVSQLREKYPASILLDSGDFFPARDNKLLAEYSLKMMEMMKYDAVGIGDQELICGIDFLKTRLRRLPLINANIQTCDEKACYPLTESHIIKQAGKFKVAVLSIINPDVFMLFPQEKIKDIKLSGHIEFLKGAVSEIRKEADIVALLSHCGDDEDKKIASEIAGIDVIVGGHSQTFHKEPVKIGNTLIVQGGENGHRVGVLKLKLSDNKTIESFSNEFVLLNKSIPDNTAARSLVNEYNTELKKNMKNLLK